MRRKVRPATSVFISSLLFACFYFSLFRSVDRHPPSSSPLSDYHHHPNLPLPLLLHSQHQYSTLSSSSSSPAPLRRPAASYSVLFPDWEVLVLLHEPPQPAGDAYFCHFQDGSVYPARPSVGVIRGAADYTTFKCRMPPSVRRLRPFFSPFVSALPEKSPEFPSSALEMSRWNFLAYEVLSTVDDIVLFVKGVNSRQGRNVPPSDLRCVFSNGAKTAVTSSSQEVFRCPHPTTTTSAAGEVPLKVSLELTGDGSQPPRVVPSIAYYTPPPQNPPPPSAATSPKAQLCACTMARDAGKFLREWVMYHAAIGVERFILYDNGSEDDTASTVEDLAVGGYDVTRVPWAWEKTQEAGFSHCAVSYKDACAWMAFMDVDEFIFSPAWARSSFPSKDMLNSFLTPNSSFLRSSIPSEMPAVGQISMRCYEFGPSNRTSHPEEGVTQGYTCRRQVEERHKSMVQLDAIDDSLQNVIHHFELKDGYRTEKLAAQEAVVNHYKYQAWPEFKKKFRRRVSAYVVDWQNAVNPASKDRAPGLGFQPVEPAGWPLRFCEVVDTRLRELAARWFRSEGPAGQAMAWQDG